MLPSLSCFRSWVGRFLAVGVAMVVIVLAPLPAARSQNAAFRPPIVKSFRHANTLKKIDSLDWIGLYEQLEPYRRWWKETAACAGIPLPPTRPDSVQFYYINAPEFVPMPIERGAKMVAGITYAASEQIYLAVVRVRDQFTVKHEMLHQILYWWGEPDWHDDARPEFKRCGLQIDR